MPNEVSLYNYTGRSLMVKKNDGIKESTDSSTTIEDEDSRGTPSFHTTSLLKVSYATDYY